MSFEIQNASGQVCRPHPCEFEIAAEGLAGHGDPKFVGLNGSYYSANFDGRNVVFSDDQRKYVARWVQGTNATLIAGACGSLPEFHFTFMDHGKSPQRLHAQWTFAGSEANAIHQWQQAGFVLSRIDRYLNRNHPSTSIHLRTRGMGVRGADSSHALVYAKASDGCAAGEIHVGEFNPKTGYGIGFLFHQMERWGTRRMFATQGKASMK